MIENGPALPVKRITPHARTLGDMFRRRAKASSSAAAVYEKRGGSWEKTTWGQLYELARRAARGLAEQGVRRGDRVAILGPTRAPWAILDMAAQLLGAQSFGIYPKQTPEQIRYLLSHSETKIVYVDGKEELDSVLEAVKDLPCVLAIIPWEDSLAKSESARDSRIKSPEALLGKPLDEDEIDRHLEAISPEDTAILIYTSGTTGPPKGAMISHTNILSLLDAQKGMTELLQNDLFLSFLPMAHAAERVLGFFGRIDAGIATAYARKMSTVLEDVADVKPTLFGAVPRIFEKAYAKIQSELLKKPPAVQKIFRWALAVGIKCVRLTLAKQRVPKRLRIQRAIADRLVFQKIRSVFGGRVRYFVTGAAPIAIEILELFWAVGLPIYELYGMTEATVATHGNRPGAVKLGTVGKVISPLEAKVAEDGEILLRGPWIFQGYLKSEDATKEALDGGWLHTGDIGTIDGEGFLRITDRKKHLIITAGGKNLAPANIENAIKNQDPLVSQVYAHGDRRSYVIALVAPSPLETLSWGEERGLVDSVLVAALTKEVLADPASRSPALNAAMGKVVVHPAYGERIREAVRRGNKTLAHVEQVRRVVVLERDFSQEAGELTPTMKVKRKAVEQAYSALIDAVYEGGGLEV